LIQLLNRLEKIHSLGLIHGNICPDALRIDQERDNKVILCDFYFSRKLSRGSNTLKLDSIRNRFEGNAFFSSTAACRQEDMSIYDDLESTFILISYLLNDCALPWMQVGEENIFSSSMLQVVDRRLKTNYNERLVESLPSGLRAQLVQIFTRSLFKTQEPHYKVQISRFYSEVRSVLFSLKNKNESASDDSFFAAGKLAYNALSIAPPQQDIC
jgi:serine/threonine protein kinase